MVFRDSIQGVKKLMSAFLCIYKAFKIGSFVQITHQQIVFYCRISWTLLLSVLYIIPYVFVNFIAESYKPIKIYFQMVRESRVATRNQAIGMLKAGRSRKVLLDNQERLCVPYVGAGTGKRAVFLPRTCKDGEEKRRLVKSLKSLLRKLWVKSGNPPARYQKY